MGATARRARGTCRNSPHKFASPLRRETAEIFRLLRIESRSTSEAGTDTTTLCGPSVLFLTKPHQQTGGNPMANNIVQVTDDTFDHEVLQSSLPVLVDFWAPWCGPCRAIAPVMDELAGEYAGKLRIVKMNVDDNLRTPALYGVRGIPNLILFKDGQVQQQIVGAVPKTHLVKALATVV